MTEVRPAIRRLRRVAPLALMIALLTASCGDDDNGTATPTQPSSATTGTVATTEDFETLPTPTVPTGKGTSEGKATLETEDRNLLPLLGGNIGRFAPTQIEGKSLRVVALASPESFWAGRSRGQRILVKMRLKGGSPPRIAVGQDVEFIGALTAVAGDAGALGVENNSDKKLLARQGAYVDASVADVKLG